MTRRPIGLLVGMLLLAGCGGSHPALSSSAASVLQKDADALAAAARSGNRAALKAAYDALQADLARQRSSGGVTAARADSVLAAAQRVLADGQAAAPVVTPSPVATTARPAAPAPRHHKGHKKAEGGGGDGGGD